MRREVLYRENTITESRPSESQAPIPFGEDHRDGRRVHQFQYKVDKGPIQRLIVEREIAGTAAEGRECVRRLRDRLWPVCEYTSRLRSRRPLPGLRSRSFGPTQLVLSQVSTGSSINTETSPRWHVSTEHHYVVHEWVGTSAVPVPQPMPIPVSPQTGFSTVIPVRRASRSTGSTSRSSSWTIVPDQSPAAGRRTRSIGWLLSLFTDRVIGSRVMTGAVGVAVGTTRVYRSIPSLSMHRRDRGP